VSASPIGLRLGGIFGGLGSKLTENRGGASLESTAGFHLRPSFQFPMVSLSDGRTVVQGEVFGVLAFYGTGPFMTLQGSALSNTGKLIGGGFAARANIYVSDHVPFAITPALGVGVGSQFFATTSADGACDASSGVPTVFVNLDLAVRYELFSHHAFYFSPANFYFIAPGLSDGDPIDLSCAGLGTVTPKDAYGTDSAQVNYNIDFGYMFQF
jgi:hypothetical protein